MDPISIPEPHGVFPAEDDIARLLATTPRQGVEVDARKLYLDLAEAIIDQAVHWIGPDGTVNDPLEGPDRRWQGGTSARFACPAAILARERERSDLVQPAIRALGRAIDGVVTPAADGEPVPPGVLDLCLKEALVAYAVLCEIADAGVTADWAEALARLKPSNAYTADATIAAGLAPTNYGVSAVVGEWLRFRQGLGDERPWIECHLAHELPLFTEYGMYRDPGDPMLYDLMVRQNLSELLHSGYDGRFRSAIEELLRRGGAATLLTLSPCGYGPCGGRSNALVHNEAMVAFVCEYQARHLAGSGEQRLAEAFREAGVRAARATVEFVQQRPLRYVKNRFPPDTRHGKDAGYGEYANYALLAASLFARTGRLADDGLKASSAPIASSGYVLSLWPAFHRVFATVGDLHACVDTRAQGGHDATGLVRFHRAQAPPEIALGMGIPAEPKYVTHGAQGGKAAAIGPCWMAADGSWQSLAALSEEIEDVAFTRDEASPRAVAWSIRWMLCSASRLPVRCVHQSFRLTPDELVVRVRTYGTVTRTGFELPCLLDSGGAGAETELNTHVVRVRYGGWIYEARVSEAAAVALESETLANRNACYRVARFVVAAPTFEAQLRITREREPA